MTFQPYGFLKYTDLMKVSFCLTPTCLLDTALNPNILHAKVLTLGSPQNLLVNLTREGARL